jgi:hypothetical protein
VDIVFRDNPRPSAALLFEIHRGRTGRHEHCISRERGFGGHV